MEKIGLTLDDVAMNVIVTNSKCRVAFTLAEVLITLGIIGIVAAMTLPSLISNKQSKELQVGLNTAYALMQEGLSRMSLDKGYTVKTTDNVVYPREEGLFVDDFKNYFSKIYDCGIYRPDPKICIDRSDGLGGGITDASYKNFAKNSIISTGALDDGQFVLPNGMLVIIENPADRFFLSVDVNGKNKKPNVWGRDLFTFQLMNDGKLLPMGAVGTMYNNIECSKTSQSAMNGVGCTYRALTDKTFWDDYR